MTANTDLTREGRIIGWYSTGAASAVMCKLEPCEPVRCDLGDSEDPDNHRFARDCEAWFGRPVTSISSQDYLTIDEVFEHRNFCPVPAVRHAPER